MIVIDHIIFTLCIYIYIILSYYHIIILSYIIIYYHILSYILHVISTYHMINPLRPVASGTESDPRGNGHALVVYMVLMSNTMLKTRCNM